MSLPQHVACVWVCAAISRAARVNGIGRANHAALVRLSRLVAPMSHCRKRNVRPYSLDSMLRMRSVQPCGANATPPVPKPEVKPLMPSGRASTASVTVRALSLLAFTLYGDHCGSLLVFRTAAKYVAAMTTAGLRADVAKVLEHGTPLPDEAAKVVVARWSGELARVRALLADGTRGLPSYDVEASQQTFTKLRADVDLARSKVTPKKKFSFARKRKDKPSADAAPCSMAEATPSGGQGPVPAGSDDVFGAASASAASAALLDRLGAEEETIEGKSDSVVMVGAGSGGDDVRLVGLHRCVILITRRLSALRIDGLKDCLVLAVPISGSVLLHDCLSCRIHMAARQFRLHRSSGCTFMVHAMSRPIIEHCESLAFAPYALTHDKTAASSSDGGIARQRELLVAAGLLQSISASSAADLAAVRNWQHVDDFGWIKATRSPNWTVLGRSSWPRELPSSAVVAGFALVAEPLGWLDSDDVACAEEVAVAAAGATCSAEDPAVGSDRESGLDEDDEL